MNVLFITEDHSSRNYGITAVVSRLLNEFVEQDTTIHPFLVATGWEMVSQHDDIFTELVPFSKIGTVWKWSPFLTRRIEEIIETQHIDLIHVHGIWMAAQLGGLVASKKMNIPCVVSPHGMLAPWFWEETGFVKNFKKLLYFNFVLSRSLSSNTVIHAITPLEKESLKSWFPNHRVTVIPNAISVKEQDTTNTMTEKLLLFIGRLHPVKGVDLLVKAFHQANLDDEWRLMIVGPEEDPRYSQRIRSLIATMGLSTKVKLIGPVFGTQKWSLIQKAWAMIVPSYSEVMGMVNLEAAICSVPSITTYETGLWDWQEGGGLLINPVVDELAVAIRQACGWSVEERNKQGKNSYQLVVDKYSWNAVIPQWVDFYSSLINE